MTVLPGIQPNSRRPRSNGSRWRDSGSVDFCGDNTPTRGVRTAGGRPTSHPAPTITSIPTIIASHLALHFIAVLVLRYRRHFTRSDVLRRSEAVSFFWLADASYCVDSRSNNQPLLNAARQD